ncbi:MAG TPA: hotdog domain-containing protein [Thermomicrobiales bacterium]|nr:hotdog domain-containing protein [Thermomicrobiales bacterium]
MKHGFVPGVTASVTFTVDDTMLAAFEGVVVHPVLGTAELVHYLELAGRRVILPYLEEHDEGIGHAISVTHRAPARPGTLVTATAVLTAFTGNRVVTRVEARTDTGTLIADGEFTQAVLPKDVIQALVNPENGLVG